MADTEPAAALPRNFLRSCVLLLLRESPAHGYDLLERLAPFGFTRSDPGGLYRALRALEDDGLVHSAWEPSSQGPDRRIYEITRAGAEQLHDSALSVRAGAHVLERFVSRYEEFVALPDDSGAMGAAALGDQGAHERRHLAQSHLDSR